MKKMFVFLTFGILCVSLCYAYDKTESLAALCYQNGYTDKVQNRVIDGDGNVSFEEIANPETMEDFRERKVRQFYEDSVVAWEKNNAAKIAGDAKETEVREAGVSDDVITEIVR